MNRGIRICILLIIALIAFCNAGAQESPDTDGGLTPFGSYLQTDIDTVDLASGNLLFTVPLISYPQRGALSLQFSLVANNKNWEVQQVTSGGRIFEKWVWQGTGVSVVTNSNYVWQPGSYESSTYAPAVVSDPSGAAHAMEYMQLPNSTLVLESGDGSGIQAGTNSGTVIDRAGIVHTPAFQLLVGTPNTTKAFPEMVDANGNQITRHVTYDSSGDAQDNGWTDSTGRTIPGGQFYAVAGPVRGVQTSRVMWWLPGSTISGIGLCPAGTSSAQQWVVPAPQGSSATYFFCISTISLSTNFQYLYSTVPGQPATTPVTEYSGTVQLLSAVVLPNGETWQFSYDSYGDLTKVVRPTGGNISYVWENESPCALDSPTGISRWVSSRTVDAEDGNGGQPWTYAYLGSQTTVTDPLGNTTVHTYQVNCGRESEVKYNQLIAGQQVLLKTVDTQYQYISGFPGVFDAYFPQQITTTLPGISSTQVVRSYDQENTGYTL